MWCINVKRRMLLRIIIVVLLMVPVNAIVVSESPPDKIDPTLRFLMATHEHFPHLSSMCGIDLTSEKTAVTITFDSEKMDIEIFESETSAQFYEINGRTLHTRNIYPARVAWSEIPELAHRADVLRIQSAYNFGEPPLNVSIPEIKADSAWSLTDLQGRSISGQDVIVADLDTGVDWEHPHFYYENCVGKVWKILDDFNGNGIPDEHVRGVNLDTASPDTDGHGTSVCSILAGGKAASDEHVGVAPNATLVVGRIFPPNEVPITVAAQWAYETGARVILYEVGSWVFEYLDGSSAEETQIDELTSNGVVVVVPAGNLAGSNKHSRMVIPSGPITVSLKFNVPESVGITNVPFSILWITPSNNLAFELETPSGSSVSLPGDESWVTVSGHSVWSYRSTSPRNTARFDVSISKSPVETGDWTLTVTNPSASSEEINGYITDDVTAWAGGATFTAYTEDTLTITWPSTADSAISVASYATRARVTGTVGDISYFSGRGPRIDGTQKPDIAAPGHFDIWAAVSQYAGYPSGSFDWFSGTSAAGPHVAGTVALIVQANPNLLPSTIKDIIRNTARTDSFVLAPGPVPNTVWGWGKIDALTSVQTALSYVQLPMITSNQPVAYVFSIPATIETQSRPSYVLPDEPTTIESPSTTMNVLSDEPVSIESNTPSVEVLPAILSVQPLEDIRYINETFTVNITISDVIDLYLAVFSLSWDPNILNLTSVIQGDFLEGSGIETTFAVAEINYEEGYIREVTYTRLGTVPGKSGNGTLATLTFKVLTSGSTLLDIYFSGLIDSSEASITHSAVDGNVIATIFGDINGDFKVDWDDLLMFAKAYESSEGEPNWNPRADFNYDGTIDYQDLFIFARNYGKTV